MAGLREFFNSPTGKATAIIVCIVALVVGFLSLRKNIGRSEAAILSTDRVYIDVENGKVFNHTIQMGETLPVKSPFTGKNTGYEAERCYWTKDGKTKNDPTYVLLNSRKPGGQEPTFCPDCGRLVVPLNPPASTMAPPPPTKEEYEKNKGRSPTPQQQD